MKAVSGGSLVAVPCSICIEDPIWPEYRLRNLFCVPYHCVVGPPATPNPVPPDLPVPCPVGIVC